MKVRVENLAKIEKASIETKNLTLFVGQNSTHKSYMAHVIYEFYKEVANLQIPFGSSIRFTTMIVKKIQQLYPNDLEYILSLDKELSEEVESHQIDVDEWEDEEYTRIKYFIPTDDKKIVLFINKINQLIFKELSQIINKSFNVEQKILDSLYIDNKIKFLKNDIALSFPMPLEIFEDNYKDDEEIKNRISNHIVRELIHTIGSQLENYSDSYYFPASRTGFVLTLDEIYAGIFRDKFRGQVSATRLGEPTIDFIQTFADIKTGKTNSIYARNLFNPWNESTQELVKFLEKNIIKGKIKEIRNEQDYASYKLSTNNTELDLHLASSATLETLPFIVFLKNTDDIKKTFFIIEEPEAHLHPKAQVQMAKFIVMLTNAGAKVLVTTHSDYILNEINNCIKLSSIEEKNQFAISQENVSAYLFKNEEEKTTVKELAIDKFGIANDNFDEVLDELLDRSSELSEKILDNDQ